MATLLRRLHARVDREGAHWAQIAARHDADPDVLPARVEPVAGDRVDRQVRLCYRAAPVLARLHAQLDHVSVAVVDTGLPDGAEGQYDPATSRIRVAAHLDADRMLHALLHEFGHALEHWTLTNATRDRLCARYGYPAWTGTRRRWATRGEEWFADAFAAHHWPAELGRPHRRTGPQAQADDTSLFDVDGVPAPGARRPASGPAAWWRRLGSGDRAAVAGAAALVAAQLAGSRRP